MKTEREAWKVWTSSGAIHRLIAAALCSFSLLHHNAAAGSSIQTVSGVLYAENFTYYKLSGEGWLQLELHSLKGDVDLYVSGTTVHPSYVDYELKSDTCGVDIVDIHSNMKRPVGIGLYAHPFYAQSSYKLDIKVVKEDEEDEYEVMFQKYHYYDFYEESTREDGRTRSSKRKSLLQDDSEEDEEESVWWVIVTTILKFALEIIV